MLPDPWRPVFLCILLLLGWPAWAAGQDALDSLGLEELMEVEAVSATRRAEPLSRIPAAVTVLTEEDIFRSGATNVPEALKLVPGVHVAQTDTDRWAVGIRGFNGLLSNKHLVLVDGRPVTSPVMTGVQWGNIVPISQVKRIEVARGTRTSLWGAESFTGTINIITKSAIESLGGQSVTTAGTSGVGQTLRYGMETGGDGAIMVYGNGDYLNGSQLSSRDRREEPHDWSQVQGGMRGDWENAFTDALSFQCSLAGSRTKDGSRDGPGPGGPPPLDRTDLNGYAQFVWDRATGLDSNLRFRTSYTRDTASLADLDGGANIVDAELTSAMEEMGRHLVTWGVGSQYFWDDVHGGDRADIDRERIYTWTANGFVRDRITLLPESLYLVLGTKVDVLDEAHVELQPTIRLLHARGDSEYWLAVSRGVRADNRYQRSGSYVIHAKGKDYRVIKPDNLKTEELISYEGGYRRAMTPEARLDLSLYVNDYSELLMMELDDVADTARVTNSLKGTAYGLEALVDWWISDWLTLRPSASLIYQNIYGLDSGPVGDSMPEEGFGSEIKLQVLTKPWERVGADFFLGYIDSPDQLHLPAYFSLEAHLSWRVSDDLLLEFIGRNLGGSHEQFSDLAVGPSADFRVTWDF
ncbi:TonB-dependent receptor plug domain-containing protein [Pseudodesulfovibrio indicus]|uniref:Iron complex outermembrane receptor protein n=1 Tax=Pseudodesulfovibrio indicus TaxID=1716143 RepID=A0A126QR92_9BACT|nr:TonB-dependent receptor [Pseudodesulfovibrio indicus]AMK12583.1 TonB-dependent receptor [Pseudodesulfovibrio indicus]TDT90893.1 iron complex outermembrane receptor protein [Pseudodesulfovibrio indicus]